MKSPRPQLLALLMAAPLLSCGEPPVETEPLDCQWFTSETNCWRTTVAPALECLPGRTVGTLNSERTACTFPTGASTSFDRPVFPEVPARLTLTVGSGTCLEYVDLGKGRHNFSMETSAGKYVQTLDETTLTITCPGQKPRSMAFSALAACGAETGEEHLYEDFLVPAAAWGTVSSWSGTSGSDGVILDLSPAPSNPASTPDGWKFTALWCSTGNE